MPPWLSGLLGFGASAAQGLGSMAKDYVWDSATGNVKWDNIGYQLPNLRVTWAAYLTIRTREI